MSGIISLSLRRLTSSRLAGTQGNVARGPFLVSAIALLMAATLLAAPGEKKEAENKSAESNVEDEETEAQQAARKIVDAIKLTAVARGERRELELVRQPVLRFGDIPRDNDKGSLWIWQRSGRPQAILELYRGADSRSWVHVIHSLSADALEGDFGGLAPRWAPSAAGIQWNVLPGAPVPADRPAARARQIKELAQRFTAHEFWDPNNSRFELRLLVQPVHKYADAESGLLDGGVFLLCHETNPEVALLIEAVTETGGAKFRYALARLGHAEMHVAFDENELWRQERVAGTSPRDPYWLLFRGANP